MRPEQFITKKTPAFWKKWDKYHAFSYNVEKDEMTFLGTLRGGGESKAMAVNEDGSVIVGYFPKLKTMIS